MGIPVSLVRCESYDSARVLTAVRDAMETLGGMGRFVSPGQKVLLKPNLLTYRSLAYTDPSVVEAVALLVLEAGATPVVADNCALGSAAGVARRVGLAERLAALGIAPVVDLAASRPGRVLHDEVDHPQVAAYLDEVDTVINIPKIKVHTQAYLTLAVKNLYGCIPGRRKALWHFKRGQELSFAEMLVANCLTVAPTLTVVDGIVAMQRVGPVGGDAHTIGLVSASPDPFATDRAWVEILGADLARHAVLEAARRLGQGASVDLQNLTFPVCRPGECRAANFQLCPDDDRMPIRFSVPHILRGLWRQYWARRADTASATS